ncbi:LicD family protein [Alkaliflexus imshenetskii]|uniref:LicD family protein n=1 Tax=Alkaliflexus imshenetskii TaxID=286730 RepID=UPI00047D7B3E|nr:LicD family protein [Alkaliflexus imshenetskii]
MSIKETISVRINNIPLVFKALRFLYLLVTFRLWKEMFFKKHFEANSFDVLCSAKKALNNAGVEFWLDFGTLLGIHRNGAFIKNDLDIDLGIYIQTDYSIIDRCMREEGFKLFRGISLDGGQYGMELSYIKNDIKIDLFFYSQIEANRYRVHLFVNFPGCGEKQSIKKYGGLRPIEQYMILDGLKSCEFRGETFNIPSNVEEYLAYHYGNDYMIPRSWDYANVEKDNLNACYLPDKVGVVFREFK